MSRRIASSVWILLFAVAAYAANGAQSHLQFAHGERLSVFVCGLGGGHTIELQLGDAAPTDTIVETCCGDCAPAFADIPKSPADSVALAAWPAPAHAFARPNAPLIRTPLWPGAPPLGPPAPSKA